MSSSLGSPDFTGVTETPGTLVSREAASMALSRYEMVSQLSTGRRVLEIACGSGQGLGYVARAAAWVVGGDITHGLLERARHHYGGTCPLVRFDAHAIPFADQSFDLIQIHEAIYYMATPEQVFRECQRVLRPAGVLVVSSINPSWPDFNPSPHATRYFDAAGLLNALRAHFADVEILFGFPVHRPSPLTSTVSVIKRLAVRLDLIPKTMGGKAWLKRIFLGPLIPVPPELTPDTAPFDAPIAAPLDLSPRFRILYAVAKL